MVCQEKMFGLQIPSDCAFKGGVFVRLLSKIVRIRGTGYSTSKLASTFHEALLAVWRLSSLIII